MALVKRTLNNVGDPIVAPDGTIKQGIQVKFQLVDVARRQPISLFDAATEGGEYVVETTVTATTDALGLFTVDLWPNNRGEAATYYKVTMPGTIIKPFYIQIVEGVGAISLLAAKAAVEAVSPQVLSLFDQVLASLTSQINSLAPLASPALTGTPTAPTAAPGTNTTQLATTAFVKASGDTKSPIAGPGAAQAFTVGALSALSLATTADITINHTSHAMMKVNAALDKYAQLGLYEVDALKWNIYNDYVNDNLVFGNSGGAKLSLTPAGNLSIRQAATSMVEVGQDATHGVYLGWNYNAAAASAYASISTYAGNNGLSLMPSGGNVWLGATADNGSGALLQVAGKATFAGQIVYNITNAVIPLAANGDFQIYKISDTQIGLQLRGSDGVTRSASLALA